VRIGHGHQTLDGHLTPSQAIDLFLAAKAAEGISPKTATSYRMSWLVSGARSRLIRGSTN
jgi:hypothetical protein